MLTRRDLIHSRQFLLRRTVTSFVTHQPDPLEWSGLRLAGATLVAAMLLVIAMAAVGVYGFIRPAGNRSWQSCDRVIIEAESGAPYVCGGGVLYPVANFASAALLRGLAEGPIRVSRKSLTWPRGPVVGIPGAPGTVPGVRDLLTDEWSYCVRPAADRPQAVVLAGMPIPGTPVPLATGEGLAVRDYTTGDLSLVYQGRRHEIADVTVVSQALRISQRDTVDVSPAWLATMPVADPLTSVEIAGRGGAVRGLPGVKVGQLVAAQGEPAHFVGRPDGLQPVTPLQEALVRATAQDTSPPIEIDALQLSGVAKLEPLGEQLVGDGSVPAIVPLTRSLGVVCATVADPSDARLVTVGGVVPVGTEPATESAPASSSGTPLADEVVVPPGHGVLVRSLASPDAAEGTVYLVVDTGWRYAIGTATALERLGYREAPVVALPSTLVERLPQGPVLTEAGLSIIEP